MPMRRYRSSLSRHGIADREGAQWKLESQDSRTGRRATQRHGLARVLERCSRERTRESFPSRITGLVSEMFAPSVAVSLLPASELAGYHNGQVFIRNSMHVPLNKEAVRDAMPAFFDLLRAEEHPAVRVVLGLIFVYIHPYMDGNGRLGRFLMNTMMMSAGYLWTVIPLSERRTYMAAKKRASRKTSVHSRPSLPSLSGIA